MALLQKDRLVVGSHPRPLIIAHRGASGLAPENTMAAFKLAIAMGAEGVEMDVHLSADGYPVVIHDARVDRTTDGRGYVSSFTVNQLQGLNASEWFTRRLTIRPRKRVMVENALKKAEGLTTQFLKEPVPTLDRVLTLLAQANLARVYIEVKGNPSNKDALLEATLALVRESGMEQSVTLLSFDHQVVKRAKEIMPEIRTAATFSIARRAVVSARSILQQVKSVSADEAALHFGLATRRTVAALHEAGLSVSAWTANNRVVFRRLIACGVDSIMTNFPDRLINVIPPPPRA